LESLPDEWQSEDLREDLRTVEGPEWEDITERDPRQVRLYIMADNKELGKALEKYLNRAVLARGSSINLVIIGVLSLILYLTKFGFTLSVFLFGVVSTVGFALLAYNTWRNSALVYYSTLLDLLKLTERLREQQLREGG
jgi:hypothetical protein